MPFGSKLLTLLSSSSHLRHVTVRRLARCSRHPIADFSSAAASHDRLNFVVTLKKPVFWRRVTSQAHTEAVDVEECGGALTSFSESSGSHPWSEWSKLACLLVEKGYSDRCISSGEDDDSFLVDKDLPEEFLKYARACLGFARDRPDILRLLTKKNIEVLVLNGSPFLFKNGENSARRMKLFFADEGSSELELERPQTIDVMRYLLSYVCSPSSSDVSGLKSNELVERSVRKLLGELFNLSGTVWKLKTVDSTLTEVPLSYEQFRPPGQYTEMRTGNLIYPKFPGQTNVASESQSSASCNLNDGDYGKHVTYQKQAPEEIMPDRNCGDGYNINSYGMNMDHTNSLRKLNINYNASSAESSSSLLDKNAESCSRDQASSTFTFNANSTEPSTDSNQPPCHFGNKYSHSYYGQYEKPNQPSASLSRNNSTSYGASTVNSSALHDKSWDHQLRSDSTDNVNSIPPSSNSPSNNSSNLVYGGPTATSYPSPGNMRNEEYCSSYSKYDNNLIVPSNNSTQPFSSPWSGTTMDSSHPLTDSWSNYNTSYVGKGADSTQSSSNPWDNNNRSYGGSTSHSFEPPFNNQYDGLLAKSTQTNSSSVTNSDPSYNGFIENPMQPPSNSTNTSYASSKENLSQPLPGSWNNHTAYGGVTMKSTPHPSSNSWSNSNASFYRPASNLSQPPNSSSRNNYNPNTSPNSWNSNSAYVGSTAGSDRGYTPNSLHPSSNSWSNNNTSFRRPTSDPSQPSSNSWNNNPNTTSYGGGSTANPALTSDMNSWNNRENYSCGFSRVNNAAEGLPTQAQSQNTRDNGSYGYSGKSLEGSCVKEPDPLDMSEEAKAERWFRRAAQIKDISELSQIPDEDFPQIMPMRKGVNRFVVSKRKTPLERRLASQQYKRDFPTVSSEPEKESTATVGESDT